MQTRVIMSIAAAVVLAIGAALWWWKSESPPPSVAAIPPPAEVAPKPPVEENETPPTPAVQTQELPPLDASDDYVREQVGALSPEMTDWLKQDDLVRRFAAVADSARLGDYPRRQLAFLAPEGKFPVLPSGDGWIVDPAGYHRFDKFVDVAISIDPKRAAALLHTLSPLLLGALKDLGEVDPDPIATIRQAIDVALATPDVDGDAQLVQPKVYYQYADPRLEKLKPLQKQLLRMGPQNVARIKSYLAQVKSAL
jgi:Protein of unknown function (DUF3014)